MIKFESRPFGCAKLPVVVVVAVLLLLFDNIGSASASNIFEPESIVKDTAGFVAAVLQASTNPESPSTIQVPANAKIDFDDAGATTTVDSNGLNLTDKYFQAECVDYDEDNKCIIMRSAGGGRLFQSITGGFSFAGFEFEGGRAIDTSIYQDGGAFNLNPGDKEGTVTFTDCDFVNNHATDRGGAIFLSSRAPWKLVLDGCSLEDNQVTGSDTSNSTGNGGAIFARYHATLHLLRTLFSNNTAPGSGRDVYGEEGVSGEINLKCKETTTSTESTASKYSTSDIDVPEYRDSGDNPCYTTVWETITYDDFEDDDFNDGWGNFKRRKASPDYNVARIDTKYFQNSKQKDYIPDGFAALRIREVGELYSFHHRDVHDVSDYLDLRVKFSFMSKSMRWGEDEFFVEYSSGDGWKTMKKVGSRNLKNKKLYDKTVNFDESGKKYKLTSEARIRFRADAYGRKRKVYIDNVRFEGSKKIPRPFWVAPTPAPTLMPTVLDWEVITEDDFENGWGNFDNEYSVTGSYGPNVAGNARLIDTRTLDDEDKEEYVHDGTGALRIKNKGHVRHKNSLNVKRYSNLRVTFWVYARDMEDGESFVLEYASDYDFPGLNWKWKTMKEFVAGADFKNGEYQEETVNFNDMGKSYDTSKTALIRFRCKGSKNQDRIYIDDVAFEGRHEGEWKVITKDDFEGGWGTFTGNGDSKLIDTSMFNHVHEGHGAFRIRKMDFVVLKNRYDLRRYSNLRVTFWFYAHSMEKGDSFFLDYSNCCKKWIEMKEFVAGDDFENGEYQQEVVDFNDVDDSYVIDKYARIRFRCRGGGKQDIIYIDDVTFEGFQLPLQ